MHTHRFWITKARNTQPPIHILLQQPPLYISCRETTEHTHRFWITKAGNTQAPTHILLKQPTLYISSSEATQHTHRFRVMKARNTQPPHTYTAEAACAAHFLLHILPARLLYTLYISVHTHRFWITKARNTQPPTYILLKQPTLYISSNEATQHTHRL